MKKINLPDLSRSPTLSKLHLITNSHNKHFVYLHMSLKVFFIISKTEEINIFLFNSNSKSSELREGLMIWVAHDAYTSIVFYIIKNAVNS